MDKRWCACQKFRYMYVQFYQYCSVQLQLGLQKPVTDRQHTVQHYKHSFDSLIQPVYENNFIIILDQSLSHNLERCNNKNKIDFIIQRHRQFQSSLFEAEAIHLDSLHQVCYQIHQQDPAKKQIKLV